MYFQNFIQKYQIFFGKYIYCRWLWWCKFQLRYTSIHSWASSCKFSSFSSNITWNKQRFRYIYCFFFVKLFSGNYFCSRHQLMSKAIVHVFDSCHQFFRLNSGYVFDFLVAGVVQLFCSSLWQYTHIVRHLLKISKKNNLYEITIFTDGNCINGTNSTVHMLLSRWERFLNSSRKAQKSSSSSQNLSKQLASIAAIPMRFCTTPRSMPNDMAVSETLLRCHRSFKTIVMKNFLIARSWSGCKQTFSNFV